MNDHEIDQLAEDCIVENARYQREGKSDSIPCFDLLKQAFAALNTRAMEHGYAIYVPKLEGWAIYLLGSQDIDENAEYFATGAFNRFYFAARGDQFEVKFQSLPQIIKFMQMCLLNMIREHRRKNRHQPLPLDDDLDLPDPASLSGRSHHEALWKKIQALLPNPHHQKLAYLSFVLDMKPREIIEIDEFRQIWHSVHTISMTLYRIRIILRGDDELKDWLGGSLDD